MMTILHASKGLALMMVFAIGLAHGGPASAQTTLAGATVIEAAAAPADWTAYQFRGLGFALPAGWVEMERRDDRLIIFGGDIAARSGPGFGLILTDDPMEIFEPGKATEAGQVMFASGQMFRRITATETPEPGLTISGDILISLLPLKGKDHLVILQSAYSEPLARHQAVFDQILASLDMPAPGASLREAVLGGAFLTPLPDGWETGSYDDDEVLILEQKGLQGKISLFRHPADAELGWLDAWYLPPDLQPLPVTMLGQSALLYEWSHDPKLLVDGSDADAISRIYVFETCLPGGDTASIGVTGLPSFHDALPVQRLLDAIELPLGDGAAACAAANLPRGAVVGAPAEGRRKDSGYTTYIAPQDRPDWAQHSFAGHAFALPAGWTGGDNGQGAAVYLSSTGQYQLAFAHSPQPPTPRGARAELRFADGTRFIRFKEVEGETLVSVAATGPAGHLVISATGGQLDNDTFADILATIRLAPPAVEDPQTATALDGLVSYTVPEGWHALVDADSLTLMATDGRGFLSVAKGKAVLPPYGLATKVPPGRQGSFAQSHYKEWTEYGWPSAEPEFRDGDQPAEGWHFLHILRGCLPGQEPVAIYWAGIPRFLGGASLNDLSNALVFSWPEAMEACQLENAGVGQQTTAENLPEETTAPEPDSAPAPEAPVPVQKAEAALTPPPPPPQPSIADALPEPDSFTEGEAGYTLYQNARYGTFISYPATYFTPNTAPDSGDGRTFLSTDGTSRFVVFAQYNALNLTQAQMMQDDMATGSYDDITYEKAGNGWYVLSGHAADDIFYRKVILDPTGLVQVFEITYPASLKDAFDPVVTYMVQSFGPGASTAVEPPPKPKADKLPAVRPDKLRTPARGTALRTALMDAARGPIEAEIGKKIVFVVSVLRTDGTWAYLQAVPHNPDGSAINWARTAFAKEMKQGVMSDVAMVLMRRIDGRWEVVDHIFGPTDVYWFEWVDRFKLPEALFTP